LIYELEDQFDVHLEWLPYTLDILAPQRGSFSAPHIRAKQG
jgi:hypothetical protein